VEGSINLDARSMGKKAEDSLNLSDASFALKLKAAFQKDLERCRPITLESLSKRGFQRRRAEHFSGLSEPLY